MSESSTAQNLRAIVEALKQHDENCDSPALAVELNPFEWERLGWDEIQGVPIYSNPKIATGRFNIVCDGLHEEKEEEIVDAVSPQKEREIVYV